MVLLLTLAFADTGDTSSSTEPECVDNITGTYDNYTCYSDIEAWCGDNCPKINLEDCPIKCEPGGEVVCMKTFTTTEDWYFYYYDKNGDMVGFYGSGFFCCEGKNALGYSAGLVNACTPIEEVKETGEKLENPGCGCDVNTFKNGTVFYGTVFLGIVSLLRHRKPTA